MLNARYQRRFHRSHLMAIGSRQRAVVCFGCLRGEFRAPAGMAGGVTGGLARDAVVGWALAGDTPGDPSRRGRGTPRAPPCRAALPLRRRQKSGRRRSCPLVAMAGPLRHSFDRGNVRGTESLQTPHWREADLNSWSHFEKTPSKMCQLFATGSSKHFESVCLFSPFDWSRTKDHVKVERRNARLALEMV